MSQRGYVNPILNEIAYFFQILITCLAFVFNVILIVIVRESTNNGIGKYRNLITYFALSDIYYNSVHFIVYPIPENYGNAFFMRCHGIFSEYICGAFYAGAYAHTFPILIFHFLYRLLSIKYPHYLKRFSYYLLALVAATLTCNVLFFSTFYWLFRPEPEIILSLIPILNGSIPLPIVHAMDTAERHQIALYWTGGTFEGPRWLNLLGTGIICSTMCIAYAIIVCCCILINKYLKGASKSSQSIRLQKQLFRSLIYQSFVPLFTAYYPAGSALLLPVIGVTFTPISIFVPPVCVTHPLVYPLLLILTIRKIVLLPAVHLQVPTLRKSTQKTVQTDQFPADCAYCSYRNCCGFILPTAFVLTVSISCGGQCGGSYAKAVLTPENAIETASAQCNKIHGHPIIIHDAEEQKFWMKEAGHDSGSPLLLLGLSNSTARTIELHCELHSMTFRAV